MTIINGTLVSAKQVKSPHYDQRPEISDISLLVIHNISLPAGQYHNSNVEDFFKGNLDCSSHASFSDLLNVRVSAHCFIKRSGEVIQFVNFNDRAWHAGVSNFCDRDGCNDFSIGIELEGTDDSSYTDEQYAELVKTTQNLMLAYPDISTDNIRGHSDIAPGRKTDPGKSFDWKKYLSYLA
jgi:AmpD protein